MGRDRAVCSSEDEANFIDHKRVAYFASEEHIILDEAKHGEAEVSGRDHSVQFDRNRHIEFRRSSCGRTGLSGPGQ